VNGVTNNFVHTFVLFGVAKLDPTVFEHSGQDELGENLMIQVRGHEEGVLLAFSEKFIFGPLRNEDGEQQGRDENHR
jgi:hypothetical protein